MHSIWAKRPFCCLLSTLFLLSWGVAAWAANCDSTSKGLTPLSELTGTYHGYPGGLYPNGANVPPTPDDSAGRAIGLSYQQLDTLGQISPTGVWVLLSVGMSNTTQEFQRFISNLQGDTALNPHLRIVDGAQGGQTAAMIKYDTAHFWQVIDSRLRTVGLRPAQVQAIWLKEANAGPTGGFPSATTQLRNDLRDVVRTALRKYPHLRQIFLSSRIYGGYASTTLNPEPYAYESGFAVRWVLEAQIAGNDSLNYNPTHGQVNAPWLTWGAYLWVDGIRPRAGDSLQWICSDFQSDGTHPSPAGQGKVSALLIRFFKTSPYTMPWFLKSPPLSTRGDLNGDGVIDVFDVVAAIDMVFGGAPLPNPPSLLDVNCDLVTDVFDVIFLIEYAFGGGTPPCP